MYLTCKGLGQTETRPRVRKKENAQLACPYLSVGFHRNMVEELFCYAQEQ